MKLTSVDVTGLTAAQVYSTASYQAGDLSGVVSWEAYDLKGWSFAGQNLTDATFYNASLVNTDFTNAQVCEVSFGSTTDSGFTAEQLYSTASYRNGELNGIRLNDNDLTGWNLKGQNLQEAKFWRSTMTDADLSGANLSDAEFSSVTLTNANLAGANLSSAGFWDATLINANLQDADLRNSILVRAILTNAEVRGANFGGAYSFTTDQLYSTSSYQSGDLAGIGLGEQDLTNADFAGQNLTGASFQYATLTGADFTGAEIREASFFLATGFTAAQLYSTASYQEWRSYWHRSLVQRSDRLELRRTEPLRRIVLQCYANRS